MLATDSALYAQAFVQYLRKGTAMEVAIKALMKVQEQLTRRYVWLTAGDDKVRDSHAANDGKIFSWDNPPPTGNPGEEENCRCVAVPYVDAQDVARVNLGVFFAITPANRARVLGSAVLRAGVRRIFRREEVQKPQTNTQQTPIDILAPNGKPIGNQGNRPEYRVVNGGDRAAQNLFKQLSKGGKPDTPVNYPGKGVRLSNGDWVGYRSLSKSGPASIDVNVEGFPYNKIKFPE